MTISTKTMKMLWGRAAGRCSFPECRLALAFDATETDDESLIGEVAHIVAESPGGPRGEPRVPEEQINRYANLILLCRNHHGQVDAQPGFFTVERLKTMKQDHEEWVRQSLPEFDAEKQRDDEIYASYVDEWVKMCDLDHWSSWAGEVLSFGQPALEIEQDKNLKHLRRWLLNRIWPRRYPELEASFENFRRVLSEFQETFHKHAERRHSEDDRLMTKKFYHIPQWDEKLYRQLVRQYDHHVDLVMDLMLELTRAANLVCDRVREQLLPSFRIREGYTSVISGPDERLRVSETVVRYSPEEAKRDCPFPGLDAFLKERSERDMWFGREISA